MLWSKYLGHGSPDKLEGGTDWLTRWRDFVDAGLHVASATDMPWFLVDSTLTDDISRPVDQIAGGMDSRNRAYPGSPDWMRDQLLTAEQGLRAITVDAAYALGDEARRGHLAPGTLGDVTILSGDVTEATPDEIRAMTVIATIVGGNSAFCADPAICSLLPSEADRLTITRARLLFALISLTVVSRVRSERRHVPAVLGERRRATVPSADASAATPRSDEPRHRRPDLDHGRAAHRGGPPHRRRGRARGRHPGRRAGSRR